MLGRPRPRSRKRGRGGCKRAAEPGSFRGRDRLGRLRPVIAVFAVEIQSPGIHTQRARNTFKAARLHGLLAKHAVDQRAGVTFELLEIGDSCGQFGLAA